MEISWDWSLLYQPVSYLLFDVGFGFHVDEQGLEAFVVLQVQ